MPFQDLMQKEKIDLFVTVSPDTTAPNTTMAYLTGYSSTGVLGVLQKGKPQLYVPALEYEKASLSTASVHEWKKSPLEELKKKTGKDKLVIGYEENTLPVKYLNRIKNVFKGTTTPVDHLIEQAKIIKNKHEQELYEDASKITDTIVKKTLDQFSTFKTEADVSAYLAYETMKYGCSISFPTIVASGKHASQPHYEVRNEKLQKGFCVIDFGILYKNYCTDIARTIYIGSPSLKEKKAYEHLLNVQQESIERATLGKKCSDIHNYAANKLGPAFCHALGHGIGVDVHEAPNLSPRSTHTLAEGMYFTIEPGVYYKGKYGIRIEDDLAILKGKTKVLSHVTKELVRI